MGFTPLLTVDDIAEQEGATHLLPFINAIHGQESGAGKNSRTSVDGARGGMQIIPSTFRAFAKPGERIDNPDDNLRVGVRYIKHLGDKFDNDPAKISTGYISGEGNVNAGSGPAWKVDRKDGNGKSVSSYVTDVLGRISPIGSAQAGQTGFTPLEEQRGFIPLNASDKPGFTPIEDKNALSFKNNPLTAIGEAGLNLASQVVSVPASGLAGLATVAGNAIGATDKRPADVVGEVGSALTYEPRTEMGKTATEIVQYPFEKLAEGGNWVGRKVQDVTNSPILATAADTAVNALPMLIAPGVKAAKQAAGKRSGFTPLESATPEAAPKVGQSEPTTGDVFFSATEPGLVAALENSRAQNRPQTPSNGVASSQDAIRSNWQTDRTAQEQIPGFDAAATAEDAGRFERNQGNRRGHEPDSGRAAGKHGGDSADQGD